MSNCSITWLVQVLAASFRGKLAVGFDPTTLLAPKLATGIGSDVVVRLQPTAYTGLCPWAAQAVGGRFEAQWRKSPTLASSAHVGTQNTIFTDSQVILL